MEINRRKKENPTINRLHQHQLHFAQHYKGQIEGRNGRRKRERKHKK